MIAFSCPGCGKQFNVKDDYAGKKARCKKCDHEIIVPALPVTASIAQASGDPDAAPDTTAPRKTRAAHPGPSKLPVRTRRLQADFAQIKEAFASHPAIRLKETNGDPPDIFRFEYTLRSIEKLQRNQPVFRETHLVEIQLTADYPRISPHCKMLTPIFHPNIDPASICVGDHWVAGERLTDLVTRIGEMIAYQAYNIKSPLNGEAAMWADLHADQLPVDKANLHPANEEKA